MGKTMRSFVSLGGLPLSRPNSYLTPISVKGLVRECSENLEELRERYAHCETGAELVG